MKDVTHQLSSRIAPLRAKMLERGLDVVYVRSLSNIVWATSFCGVFDSEPAHAFIVSSDKVVLHSDSRYAAALEDAAKDTEIVIDAARNHHFDILLEMVSKRDNQDASPLKIGIEDTIELKEFRLCEKKARQNKISCELVELTDFVEELRERKDHEEISRMREAQRIVDRAFSHIVSFIQPGMTEKQVQQELENTMVSLGAEGLAFSSIVASGPRGATPHSVPGDDPLCVGECVVMDFGARYKGYCSDMTRTVFIGEPSERMRQAWNALVEVNETCESLIKAGAVASDIHQRAEDMLARHGFASTMGHSLGHSVGIDIHEAPNLSPLNHTPLEAGNVVTVEPGIYLPGEFGMRLEDFGVVGEDGFEVITKSTHEMVIIEPRDNVINKTTEE